MISVLAVCMGHSQTAQVDLTHSTTLSSHCVGLDRSSRWNVRKLPTERRSTSVETASAAFATPVGCSLEKRGHGQQKDEDAGNRSGPPGRGFFSLMQEVSMLGEGQEAECDAVHGRRSSYTHLSMRLSGDDLRITR